MNTFKLCFFCLLSGIIGSVISAFLTRGLPLPMYASEFNLIDEEGNYLASLKNVKSEDKNIDITVLAFYDENQNTRTTFGLTNQKPMLGIVDSQKKNKFYLTLDDEDFVNMFFYDNTQNPVLSLGVLDDNSQGIFFSGKGGESRLIMGNFNNEVAIELYRDDETPFWRKAEYLK